MYGLVHAPLLWQLQVEKHIKNYADDSAAKHVVVAKDKEGKGVDSAVSRPECSCHEHCLHRILPRKCLPDARMAKADGAA